jgi:hypothetical protein
VLQIIHRFVHADCGGGNDLPNSSPMRNREVDPQAIELFQAPLDPHDTVIKLEIIDEPKVAK